MFQSVCLLSVFVVTVGAALSRSCSFFSLNLCLTIIIGIIIVIVCLFFTLLLQREREKHFMQLNNYENVQKKQSCKTNAAMIQHRHICVHPYAINGSGAENRADICVCSNKQIVSQCKHSTLTHFTNPF